MINADGKFEKKKSSKFDRSAPTLTQQSNFNLEGVFFWKQLSRLAKNI